MPSAARSITVSNIGAVESARLPAEPHLWLIGPNGSGKSTLSRVRYAVEQALDAGMWQVTTDTWRLRELVEEAIVGDRRDVSTDLQERIYQLGKRSLGDLAEQIGTDVLETLGGEPTGWLRAGSAVAVDTQRWHLGITFTGAGSPRVSATLNEIEFQRFIDEVLAVRNDRLRLLLSRDLFGGWLAGQDTPLDGVSGPRGRAWRRTQPPIAYLPAGRSGIVTASDSLRSAMTMIAASVAGFRRVDVSPFPLTTAAFMSLLLRGGEARGKSHPAVTELRQMLGGRMIVTRGKGGDALEFNSDEHGPLPLARMSSAITELGPLDLALSRLAKGGLLILEEPESHVHPGNLRQLAQVLAMASKDWELMCTTHSDMLLRAVAVAVRTSAAARPPILLLGEKTERGTYRWTSSGKTVDFVDPETLLDPAGDLLDEAQHVFGDDLFDTD